MKCLSVTLLAIALVAASGSALAQSAYYPPSANDSYANDGYYDNDGYNDGGRGDAYYDYARVIRVDPVIGGYRGTANHGGQRCYETQSAGSYQRDGYYRNDGYSAGSYGNDPYRRSQYGGNTAGRNVSTVIGGIAGAVLGSKIGGGTGTYAATAIGSMVGGMAGREIYDSNQRDRYAPGGIVRVCEPEPAGNGYYSRTSAGRTGAYDVTYEYNGRRYTRRMDYHPGERVRVRVDVAPQ